MAYWLSALAIVAFSTGAGKLMGFLRSRTVMKTLPSSDPGWQLIMPARSRRERLRDAVFILCTTGVPILGIALYLIAIGRSVDSSSRAFCVSAAVVVIGEMVWTRRAWKSYCSSEDPTVEVKCLPIRRGEPVDVRVGIPALEYLPKSEIKAVVVCVEHALFHMGRFTHLSIRDHDDREVRLGSPKETDTMLLQMEGKTSFSMDMWPASSVGRRRYPFYRWELRVKFAGRTTIYPLTVV